MYRNGQQAILYLGEDRNLYINHLPGKSICEFEARIFLNALGNGKNIISIIKVPAKFDGKKVNPPPDFVVQGLE